MGSAHHIIIARNDATGEIELPLAGLTLYGADPEGEENLVQQVAKRYGEDWSVALYKPMGAFWSGMKPQEPATVEIGHLQDGLKEVEIGHCAPDGSIRIEDGADGMWRYCRAGVVRITRDVYREQARRFGWKLVADISENLVEVRRDSRP